MKIREILLEARLKPGVLDSIKQKISIMLDKLDKAVDFQDYTGSPMDDYGIDTLVNNLITNVAYLQTFARTQEDLDAAAEAKRRLEQEVKENELRNIEAKKRAKEELLQTKESPRWRTFKKFVLSPRLKISVPPGRIIKVSPVNIDVLRPTGVIERTAIKDLTTPQKLDDFAKLTTEEVTNDIGNYQNYVDFIKMLDDEGIGYRYRLSTDGSVSYIQFDDVEINKITESTPYMAKYDVHSGYVIVTGPNTIKFASGRRFVRDRQDQELSFEQFAEMKHLGEMLNNLVTNDIIDDYYRISEVRPVGSGSLVFDLSVSGNTIENINTADIHSPSDIVRLIVEKSR